MRGRHSRSGHQPLYESNTLRAVTGETIRPGGLALTERVMSVCPCPAGSWVLDVGCGRGATACRLHEYGLNAVGLDRSAKLLHGGRGRHADLPLVRGEAGNLPFADNLFHGIFCECVLSVLDDPGHTLKECRRVLKERGWMAVTDIYLREQEDPALPPGRQRNSCLQGAGTREQLEYLFKQSGFHIDLWEDHSHLLKELAVRIVFTYGSLKAFWQAGCPDKSFSTGMPSKPGYYLLTARKHKPGFLTR